MTPPHREISTARKAWLAVIFFLVLGLIPLLLAHIPPRESYSPALTSGEARASRAFDLAQSLGEPRLTAFLRNMPKGADLHMHLSGAVYAETFIAEAARQGLCVAPVGPGSPSVPVPAVPAVRDAVRLTAPLPGKPGACAPGQVTAVSALTNQALYDDLIDSLSMRAFVPIPAIDGHDQFFATFGRAGALKKVTGEWLNEVATRAAAQNEQYLEIMHTPTFTHAIAVGNQVGWPAGAEHSISRQQLATLRDALFAAGLRDEVPVDIQEFADAKSQRNAIEHCPATPDFTQHNACSVDIHWLYQILRGFPPQQVFAQTLLGFEVAAADPDVVGINFVMPEDGRISMQDYHLQMQMLDYLHSAYPQVHISLHAGELAPGLVPPEGLTFHIREAVELGHAERIGHGVDIGSETDATGLLREMAHNNIMVEINLTSNDVILGVKGTEHPLHAYLAAHVPVALSTDDEGVSRIDLTHEYVRGVEEQGLDYRDLKRMARTSLEHAFLPGQSLWLAPVKWNYGQNFTRMQSVCAGTFRPDGLPPGPCRDFLARSERATQQYELERRFTAFEASQR
jgi:adenosine deaminase